MADAYIGTTAIDDAVITLLDKAFIVSASDNIIIDQFADKKISLNAKSIDIVKYTKLAKVTSALTDATDPDAVAITDSKVTLTPAEYGAVCIKTELASLYSGGQVDLAVAEVVGRNLAESKTL